MVHGRRALGIDQRFLKRALGIGLLLAVILLGACGQKGDLYLPESAAVPATAPVAA
ncbi:MAG: lipoprotein [Ectothiorhodospiraceae bacterium]|nr:lipoprotein [Ectothiorhodospiraceae bacterium]